MILLISVCANKIHEREFVDPIVNVVKKFDRDILIVHYENLNSEELENASKVIICGTSLHDLGYFNHIEKFNWIKNFSKPLLGICAGMQIIGKTFGGEVLEDKEVGQGEVDFPEDFLGLVGKQKVYFLHGKTVSLPSNFKGNKNAFKNKEKKIYGVLFHPEVYNHKLIENFVRL